MARNQVMKLWTAFVTAFLALCTALGLVTTTATASVARTEATGNTTAGAGTGVTGHHVTMPTASHQWSWSHAAALPPTMKQRIGAEAHGKSPSCRHRPLDETDATVQDGSPEPAAAAPCA
ncbi:MULTISPECIES: DUF6344 domain-containing protein [unclassified Streptomyces]|uniref:DUF6344 domain-containing protein n=1 Tax=unclassified Streptomyces TaxID=2593676 RepID=UPI00114DC1EC|nr:DUF6344 domain-containing protein [Streptomyces sp. SLBN-31]TQJ75200.1 hypothetical protein FBY22_8237 [Streptomyces sp. SLBN-31]